MRPVCGTTAAFPGLSLVKAVSRLLEGVGEPAIGAISTEHVQLCPQSRGQITPRVCNDLKRLAPGTRFRLHANARVFPRLVLWDASTVSATSWCYFEYLAEISAVLAAPAYTLHAGDRSNASLDSMADNVRRLNELFECPVGVEGLYPRDDHPQLIDTWAEYAWLLEAGIPYAIDLSHLKIVAHREGAWDYDLANALVASERCLEVHLSDNDGRRDQHRTLEAPKPWCQILMHVHAGAVIFTEGNQLFGEHVPARQLLSA